MAFQGRIDKTLDKMRRGGLPAPSNDRPAIEAGNGCRCSGCSETIDPVDHLYLVLIHGVGPFRFHEDCFNAWATYR
jgi:hypothetical protein